MTRELEITASADVTPRIVRKSDSRIEAEIALNHIGATCLALERDGYKYEVGIARIVLDDFRGLLERLEGFEGATP